MNKTLLFFFSLFFFSLAGWAAQVPLFSITKDKNSNVLHYEANVDDNCHLDRSRPVKIYWQLENQKIDGLNIFEKALYKINISSQNENTAVGQIAAFQNRNIPVELHFETKKEGDKCSAKVELRNGELTLESVHLADFHGDSPQKVIVFARDEQGLVTTEQYNF